MVEKQTVYTRLARAVASLGAVKKSGRNQMQNYDYIPYEQIAPRIRESLLAEGLLLMPFAKDLVREVSENAKGSLVTYVRISMEISITDVQTGETLTFPWVGDSLDTGDKALSKAVTFGLKAFLKALFLISDKDPDADTVEVGRLVKRETKPAQQDKITPMPKGKGLTLSQTADLIEAAMAVFGVAQDVATGIVEAHNEALKRIPQPYNPDRAMATLLFGEASQRYLMADDDVMAILGHERISEYLADGGTFADAWAAIVALKGGK